MKKITSLFMALIFTAAAVLGTVHTAFAETFEMDDIYTSYGRGETIVIRGNISRSGVMIYLYGPEGQTMFFQTADRQSLQDGIDFSFGEDWPLGEYTLTVGYGSEYLNEYHFDLEAEPVDHTPENDPSGSNRVLTATSISISPSVLTLKVGQTANVKIITNNTSVRWETDDADLISISGTNDAKVTAKKIGTAVAWAYSGNNYATLNVKIIPADKKPTESTTVVTKPNEDEKDDEKPENPAFSDIESVPWAKEGINALAKAGVINGMGGTVFAPEDNVTRAQFVKMIVQAFGFEGKGSAAFADVSDGDWFAEPVLIAANNKIVNGYGENFGPNDNITCQDAALIMARVASMKGIKLDKPAAEETEAAEYAREAVALLKGNGIIKEEMGFAAGEKATRAQSAYLIYNIYSINK